MANKDNLLKGNPDTQFKTGRKQAEIASKGGKASGKAKRRNKIFKEVIDDILAKPATQEIASGIQEMFQLKGEEITLKEAMVYSQTIKAIVSNDTQAFNALIDRVEGKPVQTNQLSGVDGEAIKLEQSASKQTLREVVDLFKEIEGVKEGDDA